MEESTPVDVENNPGVPEFVLPEDKYHELMNALESNNQPGLYEHLVSKTNKNITKSSNPFDFPIKNHILEKSNTVTSSAYVINEIDLEKNYNSSESVCENEIMIDNGSIPNHQIHEIKSRSSLLTVEIEQPISFNNDVYDGETQSQTSKYEVCILNNCFDETDKYSCKICRTHHFYTSVELIRHYKTNHKKFKSPFECFFPGCRMFFKSNYKLNRHLKTHTKVKNNLFKCDFKNCNKTFTEKYMLKRHQQDHKLYTCEKCNLSFSNKNSMKKHLKEVHATVEILFVCQICKKNLLSLSAYNKHKHSHRTSKTHYCKICNKYFRSSYQLKSHISHNHTNHRPFKCDICNKSYVQQAELNRHKKTHEAKPLECSICENKMFIRNEQLVSHLKHMHVTDNMTSHEIEEFIKKQLSKSTGTPKQYFQCKYKGCVEGFLSFHGFKAHMEKVHDVSKVYNYQARVSEELTVSKYVVEKKDKIEKSNSNKSLINLEKRLNSNIAESKTLHNENGYFKINEKAIYKDTNKMCLDVTKKSKTSNIKRNKENSHFTFEVVHRDTGNTNTDCFSSKSSTSKNFSTILKPKVHKSSNLDSSTNCDLFLTNAIGSHVVEQSSTSSYAQACSLNLFGISDDSLFPCLSDDSSFVKESSQEKCVGKQYVQTKIVPDGVTEGLDSNNVQFEKINEINEYIEPLCNYSEDNLGNDFLLENSAIDAPISSIETLINSNYNSSDLNSTSMLLENRSETNFDNEQYPLIYRTVSPNEFYIK